MGTKRLNKEIKLDVCNNISLKYGTVNRDNPQIVYVIGKCWISPNKKMDYERKIEKIRDKFKKRVKISFMNNETFGSKSIINFEVNSDKINLGENKFLSFDFYLKQNENKKKNLKELKDFFTRKVKALANDLVETFKENDFEVRLTKS